MSVGGRAAVTVLVVSLAGCGAEGGDVGLAFDVHERSIAERARVMRMVGMVRVCARRRHARTRGVGR